MRRVYKYKVELADVVGVELPIGAQVLHFDTQGNELCLWALVNIETILACYETRQFRITGTGHDIEKGHLRYINTFTVHDCLWFHAFEVIGNKG